MKINTAILVIFTVINLLTFSFSIVNKLTRRRDQSNNLERFENHIDSNHAEYLQYSKTKRFFSLSRNVHNRYKHYFTHKAGFKVFKYG